MHESVSRILASEADLRAEHARCDSAGRLTDRTVELMRASEGMRLLQSAETGGLQAPLQDFYAWARTTAAINPSAGWVAGVVGIHPWEMALVDPKLQQEVYGEDPTTWVASPYAPFGVAQPVDGGFMFSGE